ncbi:MAG: plasmid partitioning protein RepB C-terminal domain-containing protein [Verrucomicrobiota bacterium]
MNNEKQTSSDSHPLQSQDTPLPAGDLALTTPPTHLIQPPATFSPSNAEKDEPRTEGKLPSGMENPADDKIYMIPIDEIHVLNPRVRDKKRFELIVHSIQHQGLKVPITVSWRAEHEGEGQKFDLVCGQGRLEACAALGYREIPARVVNIPRGERMLKSLVENIARRPPAPMDLLREIERLRDLGYGNQQIGKAMDISPGTVRGLLQLKKSGEGRLLEAILNESIPVSVAIDIAKADTVEMQDELLEAYKGQKFNFLTLRKIKHLMDKRRLVGKSQANYPRSGRAYSQNIVAMFQEEAQRQKLATKKSTICEERLGQVISAFNKLLADAHFMTLLRAEALDTMPKYLWAKLTPPTPTTL